VLPEATPTLVRTVSNPELQCPACFDDVRRNLMVVFDPCHHVLCRPCTIAHIRAVLVPGATGVTCPTCADALKGVAAAPVTVEAATAAMAAVEVSSTSAAAAAAAGEGSFPPAPTAAPVRQVSATRPALGELTYAYMRRLHAWSVRPTTRLPGGLRPLTVEDVRRFTDATVATAVARARSKEKVVRCPAPACGLVFVVEDCGSTVGLCPYCTKPLCLACGTAWSAHEGLTCKAAAGAVAAGEEALLRRQGTTFKRCPSCNEGITHYQGHGCHHTTCPCGLTFCYTCLFKFDGSADEEHPYSCEQFCEGTCACPPCPICAHNAATGDSSGCEHCDGDCIACLGEVPATAWADDGEGDGMPSAASLGHAGVWRPQMGDYYCSVPELPDGPLCTHTRRLVEVPHWSCCGVTGRETRCVPSRIRGAAATADGGAAGGAGAPAAS